MATRTSSTKPIFLHSSFRTSSTWLWTKFRDQGNVTAFYEPFNEFLGEATEKSLCDRRPDNWESGDANGAPYFDEYRQLATSSSGLRSYHPSFAFHRFIPESGITGKISADEIHYIEQLIKLAVDRQKTPVLAFTRSLGRLAGIKEQFGGTHIFIFRSLFDQWMSYLFLHRKGEVYFIQTLGRILRFNSSRVPLFRTLHERYWVGEDAPNNFVGFSSRSNAFKAFLAIHLYVYAHSAAIADISISTRRSSCDIAYRDAVSAAILSHTGVHIDLSDVSRSVQFVPFSVTAQTIDEIYDLVLSYLQTNHCPHSYDESLLIELAADLKLDVALTASYAGYMHKEIKAVQQLLAAQCLETQSAKRSLSRAHEEIKDLQTSLEDTRNHFHSEIQDLISSRSWKLTAPFRLINGFIQTRMKKDLT